MGYRNYICQVPKSEWIRLRDLTEEQLEEEFGGGFYWGEIPGYKQLHELGKYCDYTDGNLLRRFFTHKMDWESDMECWLASKDFLLMIIDDYRKKVADWYKELSEKPLDDLKREMEDKHKKWNGQWLPYNINMEREYLVDSWEYEYVVFDLVRILKTFDYENNVLIYTGG